MGSVAGRAQLRHHLVPRPRSEPRACNEYEFRHGGNVAERSDNRPRTKWQQRQFGPDRLADDTVGRAPLRGARLEVAVARRKSSRSSGEGCDCVEVAICPAPIHVRDTKVSHGPRLAVTPASWSAFVSYARRHPTG
ncbi:DUF397 domain-containing protein [Streptomyces maoxianensis]|uniref:DUF397 domain-containing protein n=1 Tax=Streptomyces maoxianensis TaxID=1459942 RepID=A0ABV9G847_9ACTN